jgi:hypothetical protein
MFVSLVCFLSYVRLTGVCIKLSFYILQIKDDSEMLRLSAKKLSNFSMFYRETVTAANPPAPPPNEHMTFLVHKIDMRGFPSLVPGSLPVRCFDIFK